jgi:putative DNA primase/helicase
VRDYLDGLEWDKVPRLAGLLYAFLGANKSEYVAKVAVKWMVGAVARIYRPGCKMDNVLILEGSQGALKSSALKALYEPWFTDAGFEIGSTDGLMIIRGMWCVELAELDGFNRAEASKSKAFFTRTTDRYRSPYGSKPLNVPRQGVFAGSVNHGTYLKDDTGNRRYWPVSVGTIDLEGLREHRDQLWAEAVQLYKEGTEWWVRASEREIYEGEQDARYIGDAWETRIRDWLDSPASATEGPPKTVTTYDIMVKGLRMDSSKLSLTEQQRVGRLMARIGWPRKRIGARDAREYHYARPTESEE